MKKVYLAASVFSVFERDLNRRIAEHLRNHGYEVLLPQDIEPPRKDGAENEFDMEFVYKGCRDGIKVADVVVAIVDGADVDSGVAWELGFAHASGIPSLCFRTDIRKAEHNGVNIMIEYGSTKAIFATKYHQSEYDIVDTILEELENI